MPPSGYRSITVKDSIYEKAALLAAKLHWSMPTLTQRALLYFIENAKPELLAVLMEIKE